MSDAKNTKSGQTSAAPSDWSQPTWVSVLITGGEALAIIKALGPDSAIAKRLRERLSEDSTQLAEAFRGAAIELYAMGSDDDIEIDEGAPISLGEDGAFVNAWVWVPWEEVPEEHRPANSE